MSSGVFGHRLRRSNWTTLTVLRCLRRLSMQNTSADAMTTASTAPPAAIPTIAPTGRLMPCLPDGLFSSTLEALPVEEASDVVSLAKSEVFLALIGVQ